MPTYDYACAACGHRFEVVHGVHGHGPETCPTCAGGPVRKTFAPPTVVFKGSGWAKVDRRASSGSAKRETADDGSKATPSATEATATTEAKASASTGAEGGTGPTAKTTD
jgi:putative FmdB family regulatory protein